ncbi:MAG: grxD [Bacteriovoracaceae bacterium]|nr:grxD [Bacteriovoracaceae bacterium]
MNAVNNQTELNKRIQSEIDANPIMLYMKGDRTFPQCGFSARVIDILEKLAVPYETHDILSDPELRFGMKNFSNWPTFPQLFVKGELLGGSDIVYKMFESGDLQKILKEKNILS